MFSAFLRPFFIAHHAARVDAARTVAGEHAVPVQLSQQVLRLGFGDTGQSGDGVNSEGMTIDGEIAFRLVSRADAEHPHPKPLRAQAAKAKTLVSFPV